MCLLFVFPAWSQKAEKEKINDSIKKYFYISGESLGKYQFKEAIETANIGIMYSKKTNDLYYLSLFYNDLGLAYEGISELDKSKKN